MIKTTPFEMVFIIRVTYESIFRESGSTYQNESI